MRKNKHNRLIGAFLSISFTALVGVTLPSTLLAKNIEVPNSSFIELSLDDYLDQVVNSNPDLELGELKTSIAEQAVFKADGQYDPIFTASIAHTRTNNPNTAQEALSRSSLANFKENSDTASIGLSKKFSTGIELSTTIDAEVLKNNLQSDELRETGEHESTLTIGLEIPLLKNAGSEVNDAEKHIAEIDVKIAQLQHKLKQSELIVTSLAGYWDYYYFSTLIDIKEQAYSGLDQVYQDANMKVKQGSLAASSLLPISSELSRRRTEINLAENSKALALENLYNLMSIPYDGLTNIKLADKPELLLPVNFDLASAIEQGTQVRPEVQSAIHKIEQEKLRIEYFANQDLPDLKIVANFKSEGLEQSTGKALTEMRDFDNKGGSVGLVFSMPLGGVAENAELTSARLSYRTAQIELSSLKKLLSNAVASKYKAVKLYHANLKEIQKQLQSQEEIISIEKKRVIAGKSNGRAILELQDTLLRYRQEALKNRVDLEKALIMFYHTIGQIPEFYAVQRKKVIDANLE